MCTICQHIQLFHHENQYVICLGNEMQATRCLQLLQPVPSCSSRLVGEFYILIRQHIYCTKNFPKMLSSVLKGSIWTISHKQFISRDSMKIPEQAVAVLSEELTLSFVCGDNLGCPHNPSPAMEGNQKTAQSCGLLSCPNVDCSMVPFRLNW